VLSAAEFDRLVETALRDIPKRFRRHLENVAIIVEQEPPVRACSVSTKATR
jgi:predicted Zn-dependent protease with MMP-like domain